MALKSSQVYQVDHTKYGSLKRAYGVWRGVCENNLDPKSLGRIKIRIPALYGAAIGGAAFSDTTQDETDKIGGGIKEEALPWAWPCMRGGGGVHDAGEYDIPLIGSSVWVMFEQGDPDYPIWLGTWPAIPQEKQEVNTINSWNIPGISTSMGTWMQVAGLTTPLEAQGQTEPSVRVLAKTPKGATILAVDTDESETLMVIDRCGQMIEMYSPVTTAKNTNNASQRGLKTSRNNDSLNPSDYCTGQKAYIRILDTSHQNGSWSGQFVKLSATTGKELVQVHGACGHDILLDSTQGDHRIVIKSEKGDFIYIDKEGNLKIKTTKDQKITIESNTEVDVQGNFTTKVGGTYEVDCNEFIVKSKSLSLNATADLNIKANISSINSVSALNIISGASMNISATAAYNVQVGGPAVIAAALHTTMAAHISHLPGTGTPLPPSSPESPESPGDPAGNVDILSETYPIGR